ncbi:MAG: M20/M25/M40 family metallo-hydrolase [Tannerellaceae bacterium]|jgi:Zn-dependent M28 family amino/carboxypeptidase|nr:M20/M25/M40 family metallo-hydrolase [Tannerellaceae bacterium]
MKRIIFTALASALCCTALQAQQHAEAIDSRTVEAHLSFLASDALEGRRAGKQGGRVAAEYIRATLKEYGVKAFYDTYFQPFEAFSPPREKEIEYQVHPDSVAKYRQLPAYRKLSLQNVVGYIEGEKKDEYILIGAHYDHLGIDEELTGDRIYNGADDNASSLAALLQLAKVFAGQEAKPKRSILFAFWDGEEVNYLGSEYFAAHFGDIRSIRANINLDMISREGLLPILYPEFSIPEATDSNTATGRQFHLVYTEELAGAGQRLQQSIRSEGLKVEAKLSVMAHGSTGSDYLPFTLRGVPILWFFTGLHPDYHTPFDETDRIDIEKLVHITRAIYLGLYSLAYED